MSLLIPQSLLLLYWRVAFVLLHRLGVQLPCRSLVVWSLVVRLLPHCFADRLLRNLPRLPVGRPTARFLLPSGPACLSLIRRLLRPLASSLPVVLWLLVQLVRSSRHCRRLLVGPVLLGLGLLLPLRLSAVHMSGLPRCRLLWAVVLQAVLLCCLLRLVPLPRPSSVSSVPQNCTVLPQPRRCMFGSFCIPHMSL